MRRIQAEWVFTGGQAALHRAVVVVDDSGQILDIETQPTAPADESLPGWLVPGFINAHCHLELSWMHGKIPEHTGLDGFLQQLTRIRQESEAQRQQSMLDADATMWASGIQAVIDISNGNSSFAVKAQSPIQYYTLIERFGWKPEVAEEALHSGDSLLRQLHSEGLSGNMCLHAPYSASKPLMQGMRERFESGGGLYSIHFQESMAERDLFERHSGAMMERLQAWGLEPERLLPKPCTAWDYISPSIPESGPILLIHNTFSSPSDLQHLLEPDRVMQGFCPVANRYIENALPDVPALIGENRRFVLGTDSLASNYRLNMIDELRVLSEAYPHIAAERWVDAATAHGSSLIPEWQNLGKIALGTRPGLVHVWPVDNVHKKILPETESHRIA